MPDGLPVVHGMSAGITVTNKGMFLCLLKAVITFDDARTPQTPVAYTNAQIICRVSGNPNPTVYWRYRGQRLTSGMFP